MDQRPLLASQLIFSEGAFKAPSLRHILCNEIGLFSIKVILVSESGNLVSVPHVRRYQSQQ